MSEEVEDLDTASAVLALAERKAGAVAVRRPKALVLGCDSLLDLDGQPFGKQGDPDVARTLWHRLSGREATLYTGHCLVEAASDRRAAEISATVVRFGVPHHAELEAYLATGEPLVTAGAFTVEGWGAPFVESIDGHPSAVMGLSLPVLRRLLAAFEVSITDLWTP